MRNRGPFALLLATGIPARAQTAPQLPEPAETVATANKAEQRLIDVPATVAVHDQRSGAQARIRSLRQRDDCSPEVPINQIGQVGCSFISIPGIESSPFIINRAAVCIDGIAFRDPDAQVLADAARVEILKGAQGALYGVAKLRLTLAVGNRIDLMAFHTAVISPGLYGQELAPVHRAIHGRNCSAAFISSPARAWNPTLSLRQFCWSWEVSPSERQMPKRQAEAAAPCLDGRRFKAFNRSARCRPSRSPCDMPLR